MMMLTSLKAQRSLTRSVLSNCIHMLHTLLNPGGYVHLLMSSWIPNHLEVPLRLSNCLVVLTEPQATFSLLGFP